MKLDRGKEDEVYIRNSGGRFLITEMDCLRLSGQKDFYVVAPGGNTGIFIRVIGTECSSLCRSLRSHTFAYYPAVLKKVLVSTPYMDEVIFPPLSPFIGLQHGDLEWNSFHRLRYHVYFTTSALQLKGATMFAYGAL